MALVILAHVFEMDNDELDHLFHTATGHSPSAFHCTPETGDVWECDGEVARYLSPELHTTLDYLRSQVPTC